MIKQLKSAIQSLLKDKKSPKEKRVEELNKLLLDLYAKYEHYESQKDKDSQKKCKIINKMILNVQTKIKEIKEL